MLALQLAFALIQEPGARGVRVEGSQELATTYARRHALVIGIDQYEDPAFPDLTYAIADARAVAQVLTERFGFAAEDVLLLVNATKKDIDRSLDDWACDPRRIGPDDLLVVFYAGHGYNRRLEHGVRAYFVPSDAAASDGNPIWSTLVSMDTVQAASETIPAKHAVFILDCCFGGWLTTRALPGTQPGLTSVARQVLTAGNENQWVLDTGGDGHSIFAQALLDALNGKADADSNGAISFGELYEYVHETVQDRAALLKQVQTPSMATLRGHRGGSAAFFWEQGGRSSAIASQVADDPYAQAMSSFLNFALNPVLGRDQAQAAMNAWREPILRGEAPQELVEAALQAVCSVEVDLPPRMYAGAGNQRCGVRFSHRGGLSPSTLAYTVNSLTVDGEEHLDLEHPLRGAYGYSPEAELHEGDCRSGYGFDPPQELGSHELYLTVGIDLFEGQPIRPPQPKFPDGWKFGDELTFLMKELPADWKEGDELPEGWELADGASGYCGGFPLESLGALEPIYRTERRLGPYSLQVDPIAHTKVEGEHLADVLRCVLDLQRLDVSISGDKEPLLKATFFIKKGSRQPVAVTGVMRVHSEPDAHFEVPFYSWIRDDDFDPDHDIGSCPVQRRGESSSGSEGWLGTIELGGPGTVVLNKEAWLGRVGTNHSMVVEIISGESYVDQLTECLGQSALYWQGKLRYEVPVTIE